MQRPYGRRYLPPSVMREAFYGDFEYIVTKQEPHQVCFGTGLDRVTLPSEKKHQNSFMKRNASEIRENVGPATYDCDRGAFYDTNHKHYSSLGLGPKAARWFVKHEYQPPFQKPPKPIIPKQHFAPFNHIAIRKPLFKQNSHPAPCDYTLVHKDNEIKFDCCFGGKKKLRCAVAMKCVPYNLDECAVCGCSCSTQGDYWTFEDRIYLCRGHYNKLYKHSNSKFQGIKLIEFKSIRDCFFMHAHNSCTAAVKIMKREDILRKLRKEAYFDIFFPQRRTFK